MNDSTDAENKKNSVILQLQNAKVDSKTKNVSNIFQNFIQVGTKEKEIVRKNGSVEVSTTPVYMPRTAEDLVEEMKRILPNFINVNGVLYELDLDRDGYLKPRVREMPVEILASMYSHNWVPCFKRNLEGSIEWDALVKLFKDNVDQYDAITKYPRYPLKPDNFVLAPQKLGPPQPNGTLDRLLDFFCPETETDLKLLKALYCTPAWSEGQGKRPLFLIMGPKDAPSNVSIGKSKVVEKLQKLYQSGADVGYETRATDLVRAIIDFENIQVIRFDNVRSRNWETSVLERLVTSETITGHKINYGQRSFPNNFTFVCTMNNPELNDDTASRSIIIRLKPPSIYGAWERNIDTFIDTHRLEILEDIGAILMEPKIIDTDVTMNWRFPIWKENILNKIDKNLGDHIKKDIESLKLNNEHEEWLEFVRDKCSRYTFEQVGNSCLVSPDKFQLFIASQILVEWGKEFIGSGAMHLSKDALSKKVKGLSEKAGMIYFPATWVGGMTRRGYLLNPKLENCVRVAIVTQVRENHSVIWMYKK